MGRIVCYIMPSLSTPHLFPKMSEMNMSEVIFLHSCIRTPCFGLLVKKNPSFFHQSSIWDYLPSILQIYSNNNNIHRREETEKREWSEGGRDLIIALSSCIGSRISILPSRLLSSRFSLLKLNERGINAVVAVLSIQISSRLPSHSHFLVLNSWFIYLVVFQSQLIPSNDSCHFSLIASASYSPFAPAL